ncbi:DUF5694 domain-containing protein [Ideonella sp.]|uniref:DUF5694 domain-containing protein n=1 Tax=Ideonella sp. TaxID=1929293 RepID=UPI003BB76F20
MRHSLLLTACVLLTLQLPASAQTPAANPATWTQRLNGPATQVLTLGSPHLAQLPVKVTADMMVPLLAKLARFAPQIITHEGLSGEQCDLLRRHVATYPDMAETYCWNPAPAAAATGLTVAAAMEEAATTLAAWPARPSAAQRRRMAAVFLAAGDRPSAQVQWLQLPADERRTGDGVDEALLKVLSREGERPNETMEIAVPLAAQLGLQRVYAVDDHTADSVQALAADGFGEAIQQHWKRVKLPAAEALRAQQNALSSPADVLALYRGYNQPAALRAFVEADFRDALREPSAQRFGRQYVAWYEVRNLRMVANIRAAFGNVPGARVLNIVGASHKPYYDHYLQQMSDVKLVDAQAVLR